MIENGKRYLTDLQFIQNVSKMSHCNTSIYFDFIHFSILVQYQIKILSYVNDTS